MTNPANIEETTPRACVRVHFIDRLEEAGFIRHKRTTREAHRRTLERLCEGLAYLDPDNLATLAQAVLFTASKDGPPIWPQEARILAMAHDLVTPPAREFRVVSSWLASVEGPKLLAEGCEAEMFALLRRPERRGRPPSNWERHEVKRAAADNARRLERTERLMAEGRASESEIAWRAHHLALREEARALIAEGQKKRSAGAPEVDA